MTQEENSEKILKAILEQAEKIANEPGTNLNFWGYQYDVNVPLRNKFLNSYFLPDGYDDAIVAVDCLSGSIIYEWEHIGYLFVLHAEGYGPFLNDRIYGGSEMIRFVNELAPEELNGKVPPTIVMAKHQAEYWNDRLQGYDLTSPITEKKEISGSGTVIQSPNEFELECYLRSIGAFHYYNSDFPEEDDPQELAEEILRWEEYQSEVQNSTNSIGMSEIKHITLDPEWILEFFPSTGWADGNGNYYILTDRVNDSILIEKALNTIGVDYKSYESFETYPIEWYWEIKIEALKVHCPDLYNKWSNLDCQISSYRNTN